MSRDIKFLVILFMLVACANKDDYQQIPFHESVTEGLPERYRKQPSRLEMIARVNTQLQIPSLQMSKPPFELRIWGDENNTALKQSSRLIVIGFLAGKWFAEKYHLDYDVSSRINPVNSFKKASLGAPKSGWKSFLESIFNLNLTVLPDYFSINGYAASLDTDEAGYTFELSENGRYRIFDYANPYSKVDMFIEAKKVTTIIDLIKTEFSIE